MQIRALAAALALVAVGLGACGGDDTPAQPELTAAVEAPSSAASSAASTAAAAAKAPPKPNKRRPTLPAKTLAFLALDSCAKPKNGWWVCWSGDARVLIHPKGKPAELLAKITKRKDWNADESQVLALPGRGVVYVPALAGMPQLADDGPFPGLERLDTATDD